MVEHNQISLVADKSAKRTKQHITILHGKGKRYRLTLNLYLSPEYHFNFNKFVLPILPVTNALQKLSVKIL